MKACQKATPCGGMSTATPCGVIGAIKQSYNRIEPFYKYSPVNHAGYNRSRKLKRLKCILCGLFLMRKFSRRITRFSPKISSIFKPHEREREREKDTDEVVILLTSLKKR